jgi:hypothetical protein
MNVVHVKWVDPAFSHNGWMFKSDFQDWIQTGATKADTVGLLAYECEDFIVVLQTVGEDQVADAVKIARPCITDMQVIAEAGIELDMKEIDVSTTTQTA